MSKRFCLKNNTLESEAFEGHMLKNNIVTIEITVENIDVKGQYINLATPICLTGQLNISRLLADHKIANHQKLTEQNSDEMLLQIGVDEAGRGPLLGSVNVAAAILPQSWSGLIESQPLQETPLSILTDSKQLSEKKRDILYPLVQQYAIGYIVAEVPAAVIDQINILQATMLGMRLCTEELLLAVGNHIAQAPENITIRNGAACRLQAQILFDGNRCPELNYSRLTKLGLDKSNIDCQAWVKGDARHTSIAAASILAKVSRDQTMYALDTQHPQYGIAQHKGYPTRMHMDAIGTYGVLSEHRRSFAPVKRALEET